MVHRVRDQALLKVDRAAERVVELNTLLNETRPFRYFVKTDLDTRKRSTFAKENHAAIDRAALIIGDAAHNLRSALDYAYGEIVAPFTNSPREQRAIQFPFSQTKDRLEEAVKNRLAHKVGQRFFDTIMALLPHHEEGGNRLLAMVDEIDIPDKHTGLAPVADYRSISFDMLRKQIPDILPGIEGTNNIFIGVIVDLEWALVGPHIDLGEAVPPYTRVFQKQVDMPIGIVIKVRGDGFGVPAVPTLHKLVDTVKETIKVMRSAAP